MTAVTVVATALGIAEHAVQVLREDELVLEVATSQLSRVADALVTQLDARLLTLFATDERQPHGRFVVHHVWSLRREHAFLRVTAPVDPADATFPSCSIRTFARWCPDSVTLSNSHAISSVGKSLSETVTTSRYFSPWLSITKSISSSRLRAHHPSVPLARC